MKTESRRSQEVFRSSRRCDMKISIVFFTRFITYLTYAKYNIKVTLYEIKSAKILTHQKQKITP